MKKINITIDGPAGSGKGATSELLAEKIGYKTLDSGAIYRGISVYLLSKGVKINTFKDTDLVGLIIDIDDKNNVFANKENITDKLRAHNNSELASKFSKIIPIRLYANKIQRKITENGGYILDGRDAGTLVIPKAELKIYLDASIDSRAKRKYEQLRDNSISLEELKKQMRVRDEFDMSKSYGALKKADDAILIDNTDISLETTVDRIYKLYLERII